MDEKQKEEPNMKKRGGRECKEKRGRGGTWEIGGR